MIMLHMVLKNQMNSHYVHADTEGTYINREMGDNMSHARQFGSNEHVEDQPLLWVTPNIGQCIYTRRSLVRYF